MKKVIFVILAFVVMGITHSVAQVTIGTIDKPHATLDVRSNGTTTNSSDGILAPKLTGDQLAGKTDATYGADQDGALIYVTEAASPANQTGRNVNLTTPGYYYFQYDATTPANSIWVPVGKSKAEWFYMPPSLIDTDAGSHKQINLWSRYNQSITSMATTPPLTIKSSNSPDLSTFCPALTANDYYYYVVGYDTELFSNITINSQGVMTYDSSGNVTDDSFINIIFVRKPAGAPN